MFRHSSSIIVAFWIVAIVSTVIAIAFWLISLVINVDTNVTEELGQRSSKSRTSV